MRLSEETDHPVQKWFLALPVGACLLFVPSLFAARSSRMTLLSFLSISSLLATAGILLVLPIGSRASQRRPPLDGPLGPVPTYLPYLDGGLALLIAWSGLYARRSPSMDEGFWLLSLVPGGLGFPSVRDSLMLTFVIVVLITVMAARRFLVEVDPSELKGLRYSLKGV